MTDAKLARAVEQFENIVNDLVFSSGQQARLREAISGMPTWGFLR